MPAGHCHARAAGKKHDDSSSGESWAKLFLCATSRIQRHTTQRDAVQPSVVQYWIPRDAVHQEPREKVRDSLE